MAWLDSLLTRTMLCSVVVLLALAPKLISSQERDNYVERGSFKSYPGFLIQARGGPWLQRMGDAAYHYENDADRYEWPRLFPDCGSAAQSPININTNQLEYRQISRPLKWTNLRKTPQSMFIEKKSTSLGLYPMWKYPADRPYISGGPLNERFYFLQLHFHWNSSSNAGSEHTVNGRSYPLEIHTVYTTSPDGNPQADDRFLVVGYMVKLTDWNNPGFAAITDSMRRVRGPHPITVNVTPFPLSVLRLDFQEDYVIYRGSLTTPPCTEGAVWILSSRPIPFSVRQYRSIIEAVSEPGRPSANTRSIQKLNGRKVFYISTGTS